MAFNVREIFKTLADSNAEYVVVGGFAVIIHGHLRGTRDLDLIINLKSEKCIKALQALSAIGLQPRLPVAIEAFADKKNRDDWHLNRNMLVFQLWDPKNPERSVDIFVHEPIDFKELYDDSLLTKIDDIPIRVASIKHLIRLKLIANRRRDIDDIEALRKIAIETGQAIE
jgi:predicted nucleotidyltransferase